MGKTSHLLIRMNLRGGETSNSQTNAPTSRHETFLASQIEQLHLRIDRFENRVSLNIAQLSNQINEMSTPHLELIALVA